ncbi:MAG: hypothetical protein CMM42_10080 [Rhodospirillaceae bacterium]|nr:hypothetical protein [Rhodospirillaceae bacterium]
MTTLAHYLTVKTGQANAIATISAKLDAPNLRMDDFALMVKAVELIENVQDPDAFDGLKDKIATKAVTFYSSDLSGEDILMLTRATRIGDMPFGSEERWMMLNRDDRNIDISGDVIVGERSLEAFGERVLETY